MSRSACVFAAVLLIATLLAPFGTVARGNSRQVTDVDPALQAIDLPQSSDVLLAEVPTAISIVVYNNCYIEYSANVTVTITTPEIPAYNWTNVTTVMFGSDHQTLYVNHTWTPPAVPSTALQLTFSLIATIDAQAGMSDTNPANNSMSINFVANRTFKAAGERALSWLIPQVAGRVSVFGIEDDIVAPTLAAIASARASGILYPSNSATTILDMVKSAQMADGSWNAAAPISSTASIGLGIAGLVDYDSSFTSSLTGAANALMNRSTVVGEEAYWVPENGDAPVNGSTIITSCSAICTLAKANELSPMASCANMLVKAQNWLVNRSSANARECAYIAMASAALGILPDAPAMQDNASNAILAQNVDGGWQESDTLDSSPYATGQIMYAIKAAKHGSLPDSLDDAAGFMIGAQALAGYWTLSSTNSLYNQAGKMNIAGTAWACAALRNYTHASTTFTYNGSCFVDDVFEPCEEATYAVYLNNTGLGWSIYTHSYEDVYSLSFDYPVGWSAQLLGEPFGVTVVLPGASTRMFDLGIIAPWDGVDGSLSYILINATSSSGVTYTLMINATLDVNIGVNVSVHTNYLNASKGSNATFQLTVTNLGNVNDTMQLSLAGMPAGWNTTLPSDVGLLGGKQSTFQFDICIPSTADTGERQITLWAISSRITAFYASLVLTINVINVPPVLTTTPLYDPSMSEGENLTFTAHATDPEGKAITYTWFLDGVQVLSGMSETAYDFTANFTSSGTHNISVRAYDDTGYTERVWLVIILDVPAKPQIVNFTPIESNVSVLENSEMLFNVTALDPDGAVSAIQWYLNANATVTGDTYIFNSTGLGLGTYDVSVVVTDDIGLTSAHAWKVAVYRPNAPPQFSYTTPVEVTYYVNEGSSMEFVGNATDEDSYSIWYHWYLDGIEVNSDPLKPNYYTFRANHTAAGAHALLIAVTDGNSWLNKTWTIVVNETNAVPKIDLAEPEADQTIFVGDNLTFTVVVSDEDGDTTHISWLVNSVAYKNESGTSSSYKLDIPYQNALAGNYLVTVQVSDGKETATKSWQVTVKPIVNIAPMADPGDSRTVEINKIVFFDGSGSKDEDGKITNYTWTFDDGTTASGIEAEHVFKTKGPHVVSLTVYDDLGDNNTAKVTIKVVEKGGSDVVASNLTTIAIVGALGGILLFCLGLYLFVYKPSQQAKEVKKKRENRGM